VPAHGRVGAFSLPVINSGVPQGKRIDRTNVDHLQKERRK